MASLSLARPGFAQDDVDRLAIATSLFAEAQSLVQQGVAERACPMFEESYRLEAANGTLINLADCYERVGKTASSWLAFREVAHKSRAIGQTARAKVAQQRASELEPRLSRLRVVLSDERGIAGLVIERDAVQLGRAAIGVAVPVDPGTHQIQVSASGRVVWSKQVQVTQPGVTVDLVLPPLQSGDAASGSAQQGEPGQGEPGLGEPGLGEPGQGEPGQGEPGRGGRPGAAGASGSDGTAGSSLVPLGITGLAVGGVGLIAGVALGAAAGAKADEADCDADGFCSEAGLEQRDEAVELGNIGTAVGIAAAVVGAAGLTVLLVGATADPGPDDPDRAAQPVPGRLELRVRGDGLRVAVRF